MLLNELTELAATLNEKDQTALLAAIKEWIRAYGPAQGPLPVDYTRVRLCALVRGMQVGEPVAVIQLDRPVVVRAVQAREWMRGGIPMKAPPAFGFVDRVFGGAMPCDLVDVVGCDKGLAAIQRRPVMPKKKPRPRHKRRRP